MKIHNIGAVGCSLLVAIAWSQSNVPVGLEPSPMETFAHGPGVRTRWSSEVGRLNDDDTRTVLTAIVLEDDGTPARKMRGVKVDLLSGGDQDEIYLDEDAAARTRSALDEIADAVTRRIPPNGCMGAREFGPKYNWPWNKYHELNADFCGGPKGTALVLHGRGRAASFRFPGETATHLARIMADAVDLLKQH